ncbi:MAG: carboxymuconolactone decarboxylase family protein [Chromatiales bacterium]|jgi:uncharacterized peroxidase-related enzyme|nr:carboxymuconolactone decarboxylase family protein [Chromatiales bacterium]
MSDLSSTHSAHIRPLDVDEMAEVEDIIEGSRKAGGYVPTSLRLMARRPQMMRAFSALFGAVMRAPSEIPPQVKWLLAHAVSSSAGCRYCQAHTAANGNKTGLDPRKVEALGLHETNDLFTDIERAVIAFGFAAGEVPNAVTDADFARLREHFDEDQIIELVGVISVFGWLNRWNDTLASDLEDAPLAFAETHLTERGWAVEKHAPGEG